MNQQQAFVLLLLFCSQAGAAQKGAARKWDVRITVSRDVTTNVKTSDKGQCDEQSRGGNDRTHLEATIQADSLVEESPGSDIQVTSDLKGKPIAGSGQFINSGTRHDQSSCTCSCGDCSTPSTYDGHYSANGTLDLSKVSFSFDYDLETKHSSFNFSCDYDRHGNSVYTTKGCKGSNTTSGTDAYLLRQDMASKSLAVFTASNFDPGKEMGYDPKILATLHESLDVAGNGGLATITPITGGYRVSYSSSYTRNTPAESSVTGEERSVSGGTEYTITTKVEALITTHTKFKAIIEPVQGWADYRKWLPEGNIENDQRKYGNSTTFLVYLIDKEHPGQKTSLGVKEILYELKDVSHLPGVCMNYPSEKPDQKADFSLYDIKAAGAAAGNTELMQLKVNSTAEPVLVQSFDFGGYAKLTATVTLATGEVLSAENSDDHQPFITLPYRKKDSRIAEGWKEDNKLTALADDDDQEKGEDGVGENYPGDGYTLFEEYRGFREHKKHIRTDGLKRDVMVCNRIGTDRSRDGVAFYQGVTHLVVHQDFEPEEFGKKENQSPDDALFTRFGTETFLYDKILNHNNLPELHQTDQHGLLMLPSPKKLGAAYGVPRAASRASIGTPMNYAFLVIPADFNPGTQGYAATKGDIKNDSTVVSNPNGTALIITDFYASRIAHEMLHYSHVAHHGTGDYWYGWYFGDRDSTSIIFQEVTANGEGVDRDRDGLADVRRIKLMDVDGTEITVHDPRWQKGGKWEGGLPITFVGR